MRVTEGIVMSKVLVAYFSTTGTTAKVAKQIADIAKADIYEIEPKVKYTKADLDWTDKKSRSTIEMNDPKSRPELANKDAPIAEHDTILLGFPIWWYKAPAIIKTFLEAYDFSGKKIILFATSGGSALGESIEELRPCVSKDTVIVNGRTMNGKTIEALVEWVDEMDL